MRVARAAGRVTLEFADGEAEVLRSLVDQYLEVVGSPAGADPAHVRLFPAAYPDDAAAADEFARLTRGGLVDRKAVNAATVALALDFDGQEAQIVRLDPPEAERWLPLLTDLRLVLADRLGILADDDEIPDTPPGEVYAWLGQLQESILALVETP